MGGAPLITLRGAAFAYTTATVPPADNAVQEMRWYRESSHYTPDLGHRILDRVLETGNDRSAGSDSFGVRLTSATIEQHLRRVRAERERYIAPANRPWRRSA